MPVSISYLLIMASAVSFGIATGLFIADVLVSARLVSQQKTVYALLEPRVTYYALLTVALYAIGSMQLL